MPQRRTRMTSLSLTKLSVYVVKVVPDPGVLLDPYSYSSIGKGFNLLPNPLKRYRPARRR